MGPILTRRIAVTASLFGLLVVAARLAPLGSTWAGVNPISMVSFGFLIIAAYTAGDVADRLGVPRITAYLATGLLAGPELSGLIEHALLGPVFRFDAWSPLPLTLIAVCLIGLRAGSGVRLDSGQVRRHVASIGLCALAIALTVGLVAAGALSLGIGAAPVAPDKLLPLALLLAAVALGGSPAATIGVLDETGSRGPAGQRALLGATVRELLAPVVLASTVLGFGLADAPSGLLPWVLVLAGLVAGATLLGARWITRRDTPLLTVALILAFGLVFAQASPWGPLLLFVIAGATLTNAHKIGATVTSSLGVLATPTYVFFFAIAGAALPLPGLVEAWPLAIVLAAARLFALVASGAGPGALPQAGTSVCAALLIGDLVPEHGPFLRDAALGSILLAELVGPLLLRQALAAAGEFVPATAAPAAPELTPFEQLVEVGAELPSPPEALDAGVAEPLGRLQAAVQAQMDTFSDALGEALTGGPFRYLLDLKPLGDRSATLAAWSELTTRYAGEAKMLDTLPAAIDELLSGLDAAVSGLRPTSVPETAADRAPRPDDTRLVRLQKLGLRGLAAAGLRQQARRVVVLDRLARYHLTGPLPMRLVPITHLAMRASVLPLEEVERRVADDELRDPDAAAVDGLRELGDDVLARAMLLFADAMDDIYADAAIAGTPSLPQRAIHPSRRVEEQREGRQRLQASAGSWRDVTLGRGGRVLARIAVELAEPSVLATFAQAAAATRRVVSEALLQPLERIAADVEGALLSARELLDDASTDLAGSAAAVEAIRDRLVELPGRATRELDASRNRGEFGAFLGPMQVELADAVDALPERLSVPRDVSARDLPPEGIAPSAAHTSLSRLGLRDVARTAVIDDTAVALLDVEQRVNHLVGRTRAALTRAEQVIRFHLDAAIAELSAGGEASPGDPAHGGPGDQRRGLAREFVAGGLQRVCEQLAEEIAELQRAGDALAERVRTDGEHARDRLHTMTLETAPDRAELYAARRSAPARRARPPRISAAARIRGALGRLGLTRPTASTAAAELGFPHRAASRATLEHAQKVGLPETYRRLFAFEPVSIDEFFAGRHGETRALDEALARWRKGRPTAALITGWRGSGRTTLVDRMLRSLPEGIDSARIHATRRIASERALARELGRTLGIEKATIKRLIEQLLTRGRPLVLVIEPLGRLHLRSREGLGALRALRRLVSETAHKVLWIGVTDASTLAAMDALVPVSNVFTDTIEMTPMTAADIEALVQARNRAGGYRIRFQPPSSGQVPEAELRERYFEVLRRRSGGEPLLAMFEWLRSLRVDRAGTTLVVEAPPPLELRYIDQLDDGELLLLGQVHVHTGLSVVDIPKIASIAGEGATGAIRRLAWRRFLDSPEPQRFVMNPVIWPRVRAALVRRGVL